MKDSWDKNELASWTLLDKSMIIFIKYFDKTLNYPLAVNVVVYGPYLAHGKG